MSLSDWPGRSLWSVIVRAAHRAFGLLDRTSKPEVLRSGNKERLARAHHEEWYRSQMELQPPTANPAMVPWEQLAEVFKESSRLEADHLIRKVQAVGCGIAPALDGDAELFQFTPAEIDQLARMDHERWLVERRRDGWKYGPTRDPQKKTNPLLVPWDQLPPVVWEQIRSSVHELSGLLARAGFQIYRRQGG